MARLLVIEDQPRLLRSIKRGLEAEGHSVIAAADGGAGYRFACDDAPDAVVTDVRMPGMSGIELGRTLRARGVDVPLVFMTADPSESLGVDALAIGVRRLLRKPFGDLSELWAAVEDAVG